MANGQRFIKMYLPDLLNDPALKLCEPKNRWLWLEMLGIAHGHSPYGYVAIGNRPLSCDDIAMVIGWDKAAVKEGVNELDKAGVFSRVKAGVKGSDNPMPEGTIFCRRMIRDAEAWKAARESGKRGGNPLLIKKRKGGVKGTVKATHKLDADADADAEGRKRPSINGSFSSDSASSVLRASLADAPDGARAARPNGDQVEKKHVPSFEEFKAAWPDKIAEPEKITEEIFRFDLDADEKIQAVEQIATLLAWINEAPGDPERIIPQSIQWCEMRWWQRIWARAPHLAPHAREKSKEQPQGEEAA